MFFSTFQTSLIFVFQYFCFVQEYQCQKSA
jgi:hypothetical protein